MTSVDEKSDSKSLDKLDELTAAVKATDSAKSQPNVNTEKYACLLLKCSDCCCILNRFISEQAILS